MKLKYLNNKILFSVLLLLFLFGCNKSDNLDNESISDIENINLEINDNLFESGSVDLIDTTTDEDIDELIDILFETNSY